MLLSLLLSCGASAYAWNVSTEPQPRKALIEEFTGIHCQNCPDGHRVAADLMARHPEIVHSVAIHSGYFATPASGQPDFRTEVGTAIHDFYEVNSYPCGIVNRADLGTGIILGRSDWGAACREVSKLTSPVNLWMESKYDNATRKLTVEVEGYFTETKEEALLSVFLLQSEIQGPQSGGELGEEYPHRHMLRARLTDQDFGDVIANPKAGEYFSRTFEYSLPDKIIGVEVDPVNIEVVAFVTDDKGEICQTEASRPDTSQLPQSLIVSYKAAPLAIEKNYAFDYIETMLYNHGGVEVTQAGFELTVNGIRKEYGWKGSVRPHSAQLIRVDVGDAFAEVCDLEGNQYKFRLLTANGVEVEAPSITGKFNEIVSYPSKFKIYIKTDMNASDNTYRILDSKGNVVKEVGPFDEGKITEHTEEITLGENEIYCLEVADAWGDGICHPLGNVKLYDMDGTQIAQYREIRDNGMRQFFRTTSGSGIGDVAISDGYSMEYYDFTGQRIMNPARGSLYIVRVRHKSGEIDTSKIIY